MPGFNIGGLGLAGQPSNVAEPRRTYRWVFQALGRGTGQFSAIELLFLKSATRPKFKLEEVKMDHNQETAYFAGKQTWEPIELTWYDIEQNPDTSAGIYQWLETVVQINTANVGHPSTYKQNGILAMLTGMNAVNEQWNMYGCWPQDIDWKALDYATNELQTVVVKMRFDRAVRQCLNNAVIQAAIPTCPVGVAA